MKKCEIYGHHEGCIHQRISDEKHSDVSVSEHLKKEAERVLSYAPLQNRAIRNEFKESIIEALRAVHNAAIEKAADKMKEQWIWKQADAQASIRALQITMPPSTHSRNGEGK